MKKIFVLLFISVFFVSLISNAQDYKETETYKKAEEYYNQANASQDEGQYDTSYELAEMANGELEIVFIEAAKSLVAELKTKADSDISDAKTVGAPIVEATASYNEAESASALIGTFEGDFQKENDNYKKALDGYNSASMLAISSLDGFIKQKTAETQKVIASAKSKYNELVSKNFIKKNDANDKSVSTMLSSADASLKADEFDEAQKDANQAIATLGNIEKDVGTKIANSKKIIDASKARYNDLVKSNVIEKGDDNDKSIVALYTDADKLLAQNNFQDAESKVNDANKYMTDIETSHKNEMDKAKKAVDDANNKHNQFLSDAIITKDDDDDKNVKTILKKANDALTKNNALVSQQEAEKASLALDDIKIRKEEERKEKELQEEEERKEEEIEAAITAANIEDQLRKIRDIVSGLVANNMIDKDSQEVAEINNIIDRIKSSLGEENIDEAQENLEDLVTTVDEVVSDTPIDGIIQVLPRYYIVREMTPVDSLWTIAGYSFIYGDARYWDTLYNANRNILTDPNNPHIILPGQILEIPSLNDEVREGTHAPGSEYIIFE